MNKVKHQYLLILTLLICQIGWAQDPHFSQYFSSPLTLNPANTGNFEGSKRLATNFRNQWQGIGDPYVTGTASFDTEIMKDRLGNGNRLAVGVLGLYDRTVGGGLNSSYLSASVGYHLYLNADETEKLSIGFQAALVNKKLDNTILSYANQFTSGGFDLSLPSNETFASGAINYVDFNTGVMYTHQSENGGFYIGGSLYHILRPTESFLGSNSAKIPSRVNLTAGGTINVAKADNLHISSLVMSQGSSSQTTIGVAYEKKLAGDNNDIALYFGGFIRMTDAIIPYIGTRYNSFQLGLTYDITTSGLNASSTRNHSFELSMLYHFADKSQLKKFVPWY